MKQNIIIPILLSALFWGCDDSYNPPSGGGVAMGADSIINLGVANLSGICYNGDKTALMCAIDKGQIWEVSMDGRQKRELTLSGIAPGSNLDFEGITISANGTIYVAVEGNRLSPNNDCIYIFNSSMAKTGEIAIPMTDRTDTGNGIEGVSVGNGLLYIANQGKPTKLLKYNLAQGAIIFQRNLTDFYYLSDICFDATDNTLWILDAGSGNTNHRVVHCDLDGTPISSISLNTLPNPPTKPEALLVDTARGLMWLGCDATGKIYRYRLNRTNL